MDGDISIQYQTKRDLLAMDDLTLRSKIATEGWGSQYFAARNDAGTWGQDYYQPKWISTHYTLLDLRHLCIDASHPDIKWIIRNVLKDKKGPDGGIAPFGKDKKCDVCVNGMALNFCSYFMVEEGDLKSVVDFILNEKMPDGGFNCHSNRCGAVHSSMHTTISVLEGLYEFVKNGYNYRKQDILQAMSTSVEFLLMHHLYKSDKTGEVIKSDFLRLYFPARWYYDILRALDFFQYADIPYDRRMDAALDILMSKRTKDGYWKVASPHTGKMHFEMENAGQPSRWNTLRALRVLKKYRPDG
jgi:hypothetical protein